jgi:hypothetical protein
MPFAHPGAEFGPDGKPGWRDDNDGRVLGGGAMWVVIRRRS